MPIYTSEKQKYDRINGCDWKQADFEMKLLCRNDDNRLIKVEIYEAMKKGNHRMIGATEFNLKDIITYNKTYFQCFNKKSLSGQLHILKH